MNLAHDSQGFLTGEVVAEIRRLNDTLAAIRGDIAAIRSAAESRSSGSAGANANQSGSGPEPASPRRRPRQSGSQTGPGPSAGGSASPRRRRSFGQAGPDAGNHPPLPPSSGASNGQQSSEDAAQRDGRGRFSSNNDSNRSDEDRKQRKLFEGMGDRIANAVTATSGLEEIDPNIKAFHEVAEPLARGYQLFVGGDKETRWYRRIFGELRLFRTGQTAFNRAEQRALNEINENTANQNAGGGSGGGLPGSLLSLLAVFAKGLIKKVPILGALLGAVGAAFDISATENDETLTRQQKDERNGKSIGGLAGSVGGMVAGAKLGAAAGTFLGPVGTVIGGLAGGAAGLLLGDKVGQMLGEVSGFWINELREADIKGTWNRAVDDFKIGWQAIVDNAEKAFGWMGEKADQANDFIKDKTGVDVKKIATTDVVTPTVEYVNNAGNKANEYVKDKTGVDVKKAATTNVVDPALEYAKKKWDSGIDWAKENTTIGKGASVISNLISARGKTRIYERGDGGTETREGGTVSWRNNNPGNLKFEYAGSADKTVKSKRSKSQALKSAQNSYEGVVDLDQWGNAIFANEEAGRAAKAKLLTGRHGDKTVEEMLTKYAISDYSGKANTKNYADQIHKLASSRGMDLHSKKIADLKKDEFDTLLDGMKKVEGFKEGVVTVSPSIKTPDPALAYSNPSPSMPSMPKLQTIADAPPIVMPMAGDSARKTPLISINAGDVGQDLSDRRIAHIVTGGLSG